MLSQNQSKFLHALGVKKYRQEHRKFVVEGEKMVAELLQQQRLEVSAVYGLEVWAQANAALLSPFTHLFQTVTAAELGKISALTTPNSVLAVASMPDAAVEMALPESRLCFYLDGIQDPGNMGTILRIADWFGLPAVFCSPETVDVYNSKVVQASMGAIFRVKSWEIPLETLIDGRAELPVAGAVLGGENVFDRELPQHGLLVMGNEGRGICAATEQLLTHRLTIPRHPEGGAESLNAAVAAGILAALCSGSRSTTTVRR
jgi:RNA methyltransferase, TrmH family